MTVYTETYQREVEEELRKVRRASDRGETLYEGVNTAAYRSKLEEERVYCKIAEDNRPLVIALSLMAVGFFLFTLL